MESVYQILAKSRDIEKQHKKGARTYSAIVNKPKIPLRLEHLGSFSTKKLSRWFIFFCF